MSNEEQKLFGLAGWPLGHSFSPLMHKAALQESGINGKYQLFAVPPLPEGKKDLLALLEKVRMGAIQGLNITIPHKQNVLNLVDKLTTGAKYIGAVNTVYCRDQKLIGDNTDHTGFMIDLSNKLIIEPKHKYVLVMGAGGSSRAVCYALLNNGWQVDISSRRLSQTEELVHYFKQKHFDTVHLRDFNFVNLSRNDYSLIVNTTPVGMVPNYEESIWPQDIEFPTGCMIYDLVYNPIETMLVRNARKQGLKAETGLGMLVEQAALSFEIWTSKPASRNAMFSVIEDKT
ncbi:MAG: shikimate dehydrogenase [Anaerolineaceae bacterium]|nr:shikimate dehydrogenase [Anaerolineaceae bacterium]